MPEIIKAKKKDLNQKLTSNAIEIKSESSIYRGIISIDIPITREITINKL